MGPQKPPDIKVEAEQKLFKNIQENECYLSPHHCYYHGVKTKSNKSFRDSLIPKKKIFFGFVAA